MAKKMEAPSPSDQILEHSPEIEDRPAPPAPRAPLTLTDHFKLKLSGHALENCLVALHDFKRAIAEHLPEIAGSL